VARYENLYRNKGIARGQAQGLTKAQIGLVAGVVAGHPRNACLWATATAGRRSNNSKRLAGGHRKKVSGNCTERKEAHGL
jgi:Na+/glutamate symporter